MKRFGLLIMLMGVMLLTGCDSETSDLSDVVIIEVTHLEGGMLIHRGDGLI